MEKAWRRVVAILQHMTHGTPYASCTRAVREGDGEQHSIRPGYLLTGRAAHTIM